MAFSPEPVRPIGRPTFILWITALGARCTDRTRFFTRRLPAAYVTACLISVLVTAAARAQAPPSTEKLAKLRANPLSGLRNVTLQDQVNLDVASTGRPQNVLTLQAAWSVSLDRNWSLVSQPIVAMIAQPGSSPHEARLYGLGDTIVTAIVTPKEAGTLIWGVGPVLEIPTATDHELGTERWAAGPAVALFVEPAPWTVGVLLENAWSFAGAGNQEVNAFEGQYFLTDNLPRGWFLESNATATADWEATENDRWTVPLGGGGGKVFTIGKSSLSASAQAFWNVVRPSAGSDWSLMVSLQMLFPQ